MIDTDRCGPGTGFSTVLSGCSSLCSCSNCCTIFLQSKCRWSALSDAVDCMCENETSCKNVAQEVAYRSQGRACPGVTPDITTAL